MHAQPFPAASEGLFAQSCSKDMLKSPDFGLFYRESLRGYAQGEQAGLGARCTRPCEERLQTAPQRMRQLGFDLDQPVAFLALEHASELVHPGKLPALE